MLKNKLLKLFFTVLLVMLLNACGGSQKANQTQQFIDQVKAQTKPSPSKAADDAASNLQDLLKVPEVAVDDLKSRSPFVLAAAPVTAATDKSGGALKLLGIFSVGATGSEKRWAILSFGDKIYRLTAGGKVGNSVISKVNAKSVLITSNENGEEVSYTLSLQEQKK